MGTASLMTHQQAAALASAQAAALTNYGKLIGGSYPPLSTYRYTPYPLPQPPTAHHTSAAMSHLAHQPTAAAHHHHPTQASQHPAMAAVPPPPTASAPAYPPNGGHAHAAAVAALAVSGAAGTSSGGAHAHTMVGGTMPTHSQPPVFSSPTLAPHTYPAGAAPGQALAASPYQGYSLANVDMSSFQGIDWSAVYNMYHHG
ncbi:hypothetical protein FHG87_019205 [Trinorchestia longiramus]|nr:hypothetical protein FHG87_019205 [Trinorchestia longiramus]